MSESTELSGDSVYSLKNNSVSIPKDQIVVITGVFGSFFHESGAKLQDKGDS